MALVLAATGLYGVTAYRVTRRTREIGLRMALGATRGAVLRLVLGEGMRAVGIGLAVGSGAAFLLGRILRMSLYGMRDADLSSYGGACLLLALAAAIACWLPARRAVRVNPSDALRHE